MCRRDWTTFCCFTGIPSPDCTRSIFTPFAKLARELMRLWPSLRQILGGEIASAYRTAGIQVGTFGWAAICRVM